MKNIVSDEEFMVAFNNKDNIGIMRSVTNTYRHLLTDDDLRSCSMVGLWRTLINHENERQKFTTSLWRFTNWECLRELGKKKSKKNQINIQSIIDLDVSEPEKSEELIHLTECLELLPVKDKELIKEYYFDKMTMKEIGQNHEYSKEAARQKIKRAIVKLREIYCGVS